MNNDSLIQNQESLKKIHDIMNEFKSTDLPISEFSEFIEIVDEVPSYITKLVFKIIGVHTHNKSGKSLFACTIRYKGVEFMIEDYKGYKCRIFSTQRNQLVTSISSEIRSKLVEACQILGESLSTELTVKAKGGEFFVHNSYTLLSRYFYGLITDIEKEIANHDSIDSKSFGSEFKYRWTIEQSGFSLLNIFFSLTDFLFLVFYMMNEKYPSWNDLTNFMSKGWGTKFQIVLDKNKPEIKPLYDIFIHLKKTYRNPFSHGMVGNYSLLVPFPHVGLIPISYKEYRTDYYLYGLEPNKAKEIINSTEAFLELLENLDPYCYYMKFLSVALPIPGRKKELDELRAEMWDINSFSEYIADKAQYQDMIDNLDY